MELSRLADTCPDEFCEQTVSKILFAHVIAHISLMFGEAHRSSTLSQRSGRIRVKPAGLANVGA